VRAHSTVAPATGLALACAMRRPIIIVAAVLGALALFATVAVIAVMARLDVPPDPLSPQELRVATSKILVVYYSRTGNTAQVGQAIAKTTGADVEVLKDTVPRAGAMGFLRSLRDAFKQGTTTIQPLGVDPSKYELVIIGTPDWGQSVSAPARAFLTAHHNKLTSVAFFLTNGTQDHDKVFAEMGALVGRKPVAVVGIPEVEVKAGRFEGPVSTFVSRLPLPAPAP
jgi:flavodoxin